MATAPHEALAQRQESLPRYTLGLFFFQGKSCNQKSVLMLLSVRCLGVLGMPPGPQVQLFTPTGCCGVWGADLKHRGRDGVDREDVWGGLYVAEIAPERRNLKQK